MQVFSGYDFIPTSSNFTNKGYEVWGIGKDLFFLKN